MVVYHWDAGLGQPGDHSNSSMSPTGESEDWKDRIMDPGVLFFALFFLLLLIGVPIAVSVGVTSLVFLWFYHLGIYVVSSNVFANIAKFPLLAIPFFILAGFIMDRACKTLLTLTENPIFVLIFLNVMLIIAGMLLDAISIYYVFLPIFIPLMKHFNWDPMWFGVMMTVNLAIGTLTPPVALNLYVASNMAEISMERISKAAVPFILALIGALLLITYIPSLSLWLPNLLGLH